MRAAPMTYDVVDRRSSHNTAELTIAAPPDRVYACIAGFRRHNPQWLPPAFSSYQVESGGAGEGTVVGYGLKLGGRWRAYRMRLAEPEPGRALTESDLASSFIATLLPSFHGAEKGA